MYDSTNNFLAAQAYVSLGFQLFPCHSIEPSGVCTCGKACGKDAGKHPLTANGVKDATSDPAKLIQYFTGDYSAANIAVACGKPSGIVVIDADNLKDLARLVNQNAPYGKRPTTWEVETGSGGRHLYFRFDERCTAIKNAVKFAGALDVRATGGYVLLPPSKHKLGNNYRWIVPPNECELARLPDWLFKLLPKHGDPKPKPTPKPTTAKALTAARSTSSPIVSDPNISPANPITLTIQRAKTMRERARLWLEKADPAISGQNGHAKAYQVACRLCELFGSCSDDELFDEYKTWNVRNVPAFSEKELRHKFDDAKGNCKKYSTTTFADADENEAVEFPTLHADAYYGLLGEIVKTIELETEADPVGVLVTLLTASGHAFGKNAFFRVGGGTHHANLFACLVGDSASGKGMANEIARYVLPKEYLETSHGLSSGEGLVERVKDPSDIDDLAIPPTKPLLCIETEFAKPITAMRREGCTLSQHIRAAWDCSTLEVMTRGQSKLKASNAYVSIIAHITPEELHSIFAKSVEVYNGFVNRFLWASVRSCRSLPTGGNIAVLASFAERTKHVIETARSIGEMRRTPEAEKLWADVYDDLKESKPGTWGKAVERARPYVVRLSMIYALADSSPNIDVQHLRAALAVWRYCEESARLIFGEAEANKLETKLYEFIRSKPGVQRGELRSSFSHSISTKVFDAAIRSLIRRRKIVSVPVFDKRQAETFYVSVDSPAVNGNDDGKRDLAGSRDVASPAEAKSPTSLNPTPTTTVDAEPKSAKSQYPSVSPASLVDLLDWRNQNSATFTRRSDGIIWVANVSEVPPPIASAIHANQDTLSVFVSDPAQRSTSSASVSETASSFTILDDEEFMRQIEAIGNEPAADESSRDDDSLRRELFGG